MLLSVEQINTALETTNFIRKATPVHNYNPLNLSVLWSPSYFYARIIEALVNTMQMDTYIPFSYKYNDTSCCFRCLAYRGVQPNHFLFNKSNTVHSNVDCRYIPRFV